MPGREALHSTRRPGPGLTHLGGVRGERQAASDGNTLGNIPPERPVGVLPDMFLGEWDVMHEGLPRGAALGH